MRRVFVLGCKVQHSVQRSQRRWLLSSPYYCDLLQAVFTTAKQIRALTNTVFVWKAIVLLTAWYHTAKSFPGSCSWYYKIRSTTPAHYMRKNRVHDIRTLILALGELPWTLGRMSYAIARYWCIVHTHFELKLLHFMFGEAPSIWRSNYKRSANIRLKHPQKFLALESAFFRTLEFQNMAEMRRKCVLRLCYAEIFTRLGCVLTL